MPDITKEQIEVANRVIALINASNSVTSSWLLALADPYFDREPELRNRLFCLAVAGLLDACEDYRGRIAGLRVEARKHNVAAAPVYLDLLQQYLSIAVDLLSIFSLNEMILISEHRDQWLHGHWTEIHKKTRTVRFIENGAVIRRKIPSEIYNKIFREYMTASSSDDAIISLRDRFSNYLTVFWIVNRTFARPDIHRAIQDDLLMGAAFRSPRVSMVIPDPPYKRDPNNANVTTLLEIAAIIMDVNRQVDPVTKNRWFLRLIFAVLRKRSALREFLIRKLPRR